MTMKLEIALTDEQAANLNARSGDAAELVERFLRYTPGSPTLPPPRNDHGEPLAFGDAANC